MTDCLIVQPIAASAVALLRGAGLLVHEADSTALPLLLPYLATARAVITRNHGLSADAIAAAPRLRVISVHGTGTDRVDRATAAARGIALRNTPETNTQSVAEHALGLMIAAARGIAAGDTAVRAGDWEFRERGRAMELRGKELGLLGFGRVARALAPMAAALGMRVTAFSSVSTEAEMAGLGVRRAPDLAALLKGADVLSLHGVPGARPVLDAAGLAAMKPGAILVNTARGALVHEAALADALKSGFLGAAALDVFAEEPLGAESPLLAAPNLLLTPHLGGATLGGVGAHGGPAARAVLEVLGLPLSRRTMSGFPVLRPCGDSAITIDFGDRLDPALTARVIALDAAL